MWLTQTGCNTISFFSQLVVWSLLMPAQVQRWVFNAAKHIWQQLNTLAYHILFLSQMSHQSFFSHSLLWRHRCSCQKYEATSKSWLPALGFIHINKQNVICYLVSLIAQSYKSKHKTTSFATRKSWWLLGDCIELFHIWPTVDPDVEHSPP